MCTAAGVPEICPPPAAPDRGGPPGGGVGARGEGRSPPDAAAPESLSRALPAGTPRALVCSASAVPRQTQRTTCMNQCEPSAPPVGTCRAVACACTLSSHRQHPVTKTNLPGTILEIEKACSSEQPRRVCPCIQAGATGGSRHGPGGARQPSALAARARAAGAVPRRPLCRGRHQAARLAGGGAGRGELSAVRPGSASGRTLAARRMRTCVHARPWPWPQCRVCRSRG